MKNYIQKLNHSNFRTSSWSGGKTTELFIFPENSGYNARDFKFRLSSATVELEESKFTKLDGVYRFITPLNSPLKLTHNGETFINLKPFEVYEFPGDLNTTSFGKAGDFNLMLANGATGTLRNFYIEEQKEIFIQANAGLNLLYSYDGYFKVEIDKQVLMLLPNELLVLNFDTSQHIKIFSTTNSNILLSTVIV